jgi:hypothetical protein
MSDQATTPDASAPSPVDDEAFVRRFKSMMPADVTSSFDDTQIKAITTVFGTRRWRQHTVDRRLVIPFFGRKFYLVALAGGEQRSAKRRLSDRLLRPIAAFGNALFASFFFVTILFSVFAVLCVLKSFLGINLLPNMSLGIMSTITEELELLFR